MKRPSRAIGEARDLVAAIVRKLIRLDQLAPASPVQGRAEIKRSSFLKIKQLPHGFGGEAGNIGVWI
jgi:hypothetical protein